MKVETSVSELVDAIDEADARHLEAATNGGETADTRTPRS